VLDDSAADLAALGVSAEQIALMQAAMETDDAPDEPEEDFDVEPDNWDAVRVFLACDTQWRVGPMGVVLGLDYAGMEAAMRMMGMPCTPALFAQLRTLEIGALNALPTPSPAS
jgi:Phage related hypothetical protein (DUF1799)